MNRLVQQALPQQQMRISSTRGVRPSLETRNPAARLPDLPCFACGKSLQPNWKRCPYCGAADQSSWVGKQADLVRSSPPMRIPSQAQYAQAANAMYYPPSSRVARSTSSQAYSPAPVRAGENRSINSQIAAIWLGLLILAQGMLLFLSPVATIVLFLNLPLLPGVIVAMIGIWERQRWGLILYTLTYAFNLLFNLILYPTPWAWGWSLLVFIGPLPALCLVCLSRQRKE